MAILTDKEIQAWLDVGDGNGNGNGDGYSYGYGNGDGNGYGYGSGNGDGNSYGNGNGDGNGKGDGYGNSYGNGNGDGDGYGNGSGNGDGDGDGYGDGYGDGDGDGSDVKEFDGVKLYSVDSTPTAITSIHGDVAQGFTLINNVKRHPCFIVKGNGKFAHGDTLHDAFTSLQEKLYDNSTEEERIEAFKKKFPSYDIPYPNADLFAYHHILTGSCRMGREQFCRSHSIDMNGFTTVRQFVCLTSDSYGGDIIQRLSEAYDKKV